MVRLEIQEAQRQGIQVPEELVEQEYEAFKSTFPSEEVFLEVLHKGNTNPLIWKKGTRESFFMRKLEESMAKRLVVSEKEIQDYWDGNRESLKRDMIHARQVLVRTEPEAKQVLASLQQGSSFEAVVKEYSVDTLTKTKGGDLGWISRGDAFEEFERVTFLLKPQTISAPFKGKYGYHIVQVLGKKKAGETSLKDYREKIRGLIRQQKWQAQRESWLQGLKAEATIQLAPDFSLAQLQTQNVLKLKERYGDRMEFIHIDTYLDIDTTMQWGLETEPWTIVVDREGVVQARLEGMTGEKAIETEIRKVLS
jgi:parvulin-like peptidyl-prolyl isomerase